MDRGEIKERVAQAIKEAVNGALYDVPFDLLEDVVAVYVADEKAYRRAVVGCVENGGVALRFWWDSLIGKEVRRFIDRLGGLLGVEPPRAFNSSLLNSIVIIKDGDGGIICVNVSTFSDTIAKALKKWMPYTLLSKLSD